MQGKNRIEWKAFLRVVFVIALPIACQNFLTTTASMVDTIMIGSQGELSVAAVGICSQISSLFFPVILDLQGEHSCFSPNIGGLEIKRESTELLAWRRCVCWEWLCCLAV